MSVVFSIRSCYPMSRIYHRRFYCADRKMNNSERRTTTSSSKAEDEIREKLLQASLRFVPSKGWTAEAVELGARDLNFSPVLHGLFKNPGASLVHYFIRSSNDRLMERTKEEEKLAKDAKRGFTLSVANAVKLRLQMNIPYMERMPEALSIATRPDHLPQSIILLLRMCDDICYYSGDRSTDISWYTKRTSLSAVYASTELYMLQDKSIDFEDTWRFMWRRLDDLKTIGQPTKQISSVIQTMGDLAYSFYIVGRNAIGANVQSKK